MVFVVLFCGATIVKRCGSCFWRPTGVGVGRRGTSLGTASYGAPSAAAPASAAAAAVPSKAGVGPIYRDIMREHSFGLPMGAGTMIMLKMNDVLILTITRTMAEASLAVKRVSVLEIGLPPSCYSASALFVRCVVSCGQGWPRLLALVGG